MGLVYHSCPVVKGGLRRFPYAGAAGLGVVRAMLRVHHRPVPDGASPFGGPVLGQHLHGAEATPYGWSPSIFGVSGWSPHSFHEPV